MDEQVILSLGIVAAAAWGVGMVCGLALVPKRSADISILRLWVDGWRWLRPDSFRQEARALWTVFIAAWFVFTACVAVAVGLFLLV